MNYRSGIVGRCCYVGAGKTLHGGLNRSHLRRHWDAANRIWRMIVASVWNDMKRWNSRAFLATAHIISYHHHYHRVRRAKMPSFSLSFTPVFSCRVCVWPNNGQCWLPTARRTIMLHKIACCTVFPANAIWCHRLATVKQILRLRLRYFDLLWIFGSYRYSSCYTSDR